MAYDEHFAVRIRSALRERSIVEKKMFGGVGFMLSGNMVCGIHKDDLMLHVSKADTSKLLAQRGAKPFVMGGRTANGWVLVAPEEVDTQAALSKWLAVALAYAETLPAKSKARPAKGATLEKRVKRSGSR